MSNDDETIGYIISRREVLALLGAAGASSLTGCSPRRRTSEDSRVATDGATLDPVSCVVRPQQTEGPFFVDAQLNRSDIRSDPADGTVRPGVPLALSFQVSRLTGSSCAPLANAIVDVSRGMRGLRNANDGIFRNGGSQLLLTPTQTANGYTASFHVALQV